MDQKMDQTQVLTRSCPDCAAEMPEHAAYCPRCGRAMHSATRASGKVGILPENIGGALAYLTFVPASVFLFVEPYKRNRFVRFHSLQCLLLWAATILMVIALKFAGLVLFMIPLLGPLLVVLIDTGGALAAFLIWLVLVVKALQGEMFQLPLLGGLAEQLSGLN